LGIDGATAMNIDATELDTCDAKGPVKVTRSKDGKYKIDGKELTRNE
jgi:hypothetical protein